MCSSPRNHRAVPRAEKVLEGSTHFEGGNWLLGGLLTTVDFLSGYIVLGKTTTESSLRVGTPITIVGAPHPRPPARTPLAPCMQLWAHCAAGLMLGHLHRVCVSKLASACGWSGGRLTCVLAGRHGRRRGGKRAARFNSGAMPGFCADAEQSGAGYPAAAKWRPLPHYHVFSAGFVGHP